MTDAPRTHPAPDRLIALRLNKLPAPEAEEVRTHLAGCDSCRALANALQPETLRSLLQDGAATVPPNAGQEAATIPPTAAVIPPQLAEHTRYRVIGLLGVGGMGSVYQAEHRMMERPVALKVISRSLVDDADAVARFQREVKSAARLAHPNIVAAYDAEQAGDVHFLVMEYVEGVSLDKLVAERGPLPAGEACEYIRQAAWGLQHAFERGTVHRDIKPHNLMRTPQGQIKVLDFGLARFASDRRSDGSLTKAGTVMGTPDYIAPEQANDARTADIRADIYALGCTLYQLLAGRVPFPQGSLLQKLMAHAEQEPASLSLLRPDLPDGLSQVVARMMAKAPAWRYQTPAEVAEALMPFAAPVAVPLVPKPVSDAVVLASVVEDAESSQPAPRVQFVRPGRHPLSYYLALSSILLGAVALPSCLSCLVPGRIPVSVVGFALGSTALILTRTQGNRSFALPVVGTVLNATAFALSVFH